MIGKIEAERKEPGVVEEPAAVSVREEEIPVGQRLALDHDLGHVVVNVLVAEERPIGEHL